MITPDFLLFCVFGFFSFIQLFYLVYCFLRLANFKKGKKETGVKGRVSIIICAFNEEANLRKNLPLWLKQQYHLNGEPQFEVLVVNDNSEDNTYYFLNEMESQFPHLHVLHLTQKAKMIPGKKFALSMGIKSASYSTLLLTDADCRPAGEQWLQLMVSKFTDEKKIVLGYSPFYKKESWLNKCIRFETAHAAIQYLSFALAGSPYMGVGRNLAYQKELFINNKGFSSHHHIVSGDDDLFINHVADAHNTAICIDEEAFTYSAAKMTANEWKSQKQRHLSTGKYYKTKHKILLGLYAVSHFLFWMSLPLFIFFTGYALFALALVMIRLLTYFYIMRKCMLQLKEHDLVNYLFVFDLWLLVYYLKNIRSIFFKTSQHWK